MRKLLKHRRISSDVLEERFVHGEDVNIKARVAKALVDLGDKGQASWDFIAQQGNLAIESNAPSTLFYALYGTFSVCRVGPRP